jgi:uncharacterized protein
MLKSLVLNLSDTCNINCSYCFEGKSRDRLTDQPNYPSLLGEIIELIHRNETPPFNLSFYGGEPLLEFDTLKNIVEQLREEFESERIQFSIATNGLLLKGSIRDFLIKHNFKIQLSLDGDHQVIDMARHDFKGRGSSDRLSHLTQSVRTFPYLKARMTITPRNCQYFDSSLEYLLGLGFSDHSHPIRFDHDLTATWSDEALEVLESAYARAAITLINHYREGGRARIEPLDRIYANQSSLISCEGSKYCGAGTTQRYISPQGIVFGCNRLTPSHHSMHGELTLGKSVSCNALVQDLLDKIHPPTHSQTKCESCNAKNYCSQACPARRFSSSASYSIISDTQCRITRATYSLGERIKVFANIEGWRSSIAS